MQISLSHLLFIFLKLLILCFLPFFNCLAEETQSNRPISSYFMDNIVFTTIYEGGYYSLGIIIFITIITASNKKIREIILSILLAFFGLALMIFVYEAFIDFKFIPDV